METKKERVAVFPAANIEHFEGLPGYGDSDINFEQFRLMLETCISFRERDEVEEDEKWKQLIPYTYLFDPRSDCVLAYQRAASGGDPRLAGKWSLGFGGHINPVDGKSVPVPHFGVVLPWETWQTFSRQLAGKGVRFEIEPYIRFEGQTGEQATCFFLDPCGNALEFKAFRNPDQLFAK